MATATRRPSSPRAKPDRPVARRGRTESGRQQGDGDAHGRQAGGIHREPVSGGGSSASRWIARPLGTRGSRSPRRSPRPGCRDRRHAARGPGIPRIHRTRSLPSGHWPSARSRDPPARRLAGRSGTDRSPDPPPCAGTPVPAADRADPTPARTDPSARPRPRRSSSSSASSSPSTNRSQGASTAGTAAGAGAGLVRSLDRVRRPTRPRGPPRADPARRRSPAPPATRRSPATSVSARAGPDLLARDLERQRQHRRHQRQRRVVQRHQLHRGRRRRCTRCPRRRELDRDGDVTTTAVARPRRWHGDGDDGDSPAGPRPRLELDRQAQRHQVGRLPTRRRRVELDLAAGQRRERQGGRVGQVRLRLHRDQAPARPRPPRTAPAPRRRCCPPPGPRSRRPR